MMQERNLLILDLDETLIYAAESPLDRPADFRIGPYFVHLRPHLHQFLHDVFGQFEVAVWSSASPGYVEHTVRSIMPDELVPSFVWSRPMCTPRLDPERYGQVHLKNLRKVKRRGYDLERTIIIDDSPEKVQRNYGNAVYVQPYYGESDDNELFLLSQYLQSLSTATRVRRIEKRGWRRRVTPKSSVKGDSPLR
jgi:RNA polymerase II subunit A small phosphatase-like protein